MARPTQPGRALFGNASAPGNGRRPRLRLLEGNNPRSGNGSGMIFDGPARVRLPPTPGLAARRLPAYSFPSTPVRMSSEKYSMDLRICRAIDPTGADTPFSRTRYGMKHYHWCPRPVKHWR